MIVDRAVEEFRFAALGEIEKLVAGERDLGPFQQRLQQAELAARKRRGHAIRADQLALAGVERPVAEFDAFGFRRLLARRQRLRAAKHGGDARDQFARGEGFGM